MTMNNQTGHKMSSPLPPVEEADAQTPMPETRVTETSAVEPSSPESSDQAGEDDRASRPRRQQQQRKRDRRDVHGWIMLDKPIGMTSTHAVAAIKRLFSAKRVGHAGTLDPLASGALPIALGEATKTVPFVMDGRKVYRFTVRWGEERDTDDAEGRVVATSAERPDAAAINALLPRFIGTVEQVPPRYSAIKIAGERAYDLARDGAVVEMQSRTVEIYALTLIGQPDADHAEFEAECGKGTYVRAIARDIGRMLGVHGHVSALRRTRVGGFGEDLMITLDALEALHQRAAAGEARLNTALLPVEIALTDLTCVPVSRPDAARIARGQSVILRGRDAPIVEGIVYVTVGGNLLALADMENGEIVPRRVFNLAGETAPKS
jgi:tRNA pseudouridine55 synthase